MTGAVRRVVGRAAFIAVVTALGLWNILLVYVMANHVHMNDFGKFYYSAAAFLRGEDMYGASPATLIPVSPTTGQQLWNMNPPHFHLVVLPLALLGPQLALATWGAASFVALLVSVRLIVREIRLTLTPWARAVSVVGLLAFAGTGAVCVTGQLSLLLLLPITLGWLRARRGHWTAAGAYLGVALAIKPFVLIFLAYFMRPSRWRGGAAALGIACAWLAVGLLVFGSEGYRSWLHVLSEADWAWAGMNGSVLGVLTRTLSANPSYEPLALLPSFVRPLWLVLAGVVAAITVSVTFFDATEEEAVDRSFALLLLASQLVSPLGWVYYLWLLLGPLTALIMSWQRRGEATKGWRNGLVLAAIPGLLWPVAAVTLFQPNAWATIGPGSAYFWAMLALWLGVLADRMRPSARRLEAVTAE